MPTHIKKKEEENNNWKWCSGAQPFNQYLVNLCVGEAQNS